MLPVECLLNWIIYDMQNHMKRMLGALKRRIKSPALTKQESRHAMVGPPSLWEMKRDFQIQFLKSMNLKPDNYFLDIGCGTLRGGIPLIAYLYEGHYFGLEAREEVLDEGRKELHEAGLEWKSPMLFHCPDISQAIINRKFDYIWAFSVFIHMTD
jgi:cyclopropane fatty-acyl-phospholipid synthase-like methyltransferase